MFKNYKADLNAVMEKDPAARNKLEVILTYSGFRAIRWYRFAHFLHRHKLKFLARVVSQLSRFFHGIEIHPGAKIGKGVFIDHGMGVVIGETAEIGDNCVIYQGVTLGGTGKDTGKRHPTIKSNVMLSAGCKILGPITVGENCKIGAQAVVLKDVPTGCTVVGVPGKIVKIDGQPVVDMDQTKLVDPVMDVILELRKRIYQLEKQAGIDFEESPIIIEDFCASSALEKDDCCSSKPQLKKHKMFSYIDDFAELEPEESRNDRSAITIIPVDDTEDDEDEED